MTTTAATPMPRPRTRADLAALLRSSANLRAFLQVLRVGESVPGDDQAYRWLYGSTRRVPKLFESFAQHPKVRTYEAYDGQFIANGRIDFTTAAGAYQIVGTTWDSLVRAWGFEDFGPDAQDQAAVALIVGRGALDEVLAGRLEAAIARLRSEWASLPGAQHGDQPTIALASARATYERFGGSYSPDVMAAPIEAAPGPGPAPAPAPVAADAPATEAPLIEAAAPAEPPPMVLGDANWGPTADSGSWDFDPTWPGADRAYVAPTPAPTLAPAPTPAPVFPHVSHVFALEGQAMSPFLLPALGAIFEAVPALIRNFGSGSAMAERNAKAAEVLVATAKTATQATNEQDLVERLARDPAARQAVQQAVQREWFDLTEVGGGMRAAREANAVFLQPGAKGFWHSPAWWISFVLLALPVMLLVDVLWANPAQYDGNLRVQIVTAVLGLLTVVGGYWLGTSASSQRKTELMVPPAPGAGAERGRERG